MTGRKIPADLTARARPGPDGCNRDSVPQLHPFCRAPRRRLNASFHYAPFLPWIGEVRKLIHPARRSLRPLRVVGKWNL